MPNFKLQQEISEAAQDISFRKLISSCLEENPSIFRITFIPIKKTRKMSGNRKIFLFLVRNNSASVIIIIRECMWPIVVKCLCRIRVKKCTVMSDKRRFLFSFSGTCWKLAAKFEGHWARSQEHRTVVDRRLARGGSRPIDASRLPRVLSRIFSVLSPSSET